MKVSGMPRVRDVLLCVLGVQVVFALTAGAALILDPGGILENPFAQLLAGLVVVMPIVMAVVLAVRFRRGHRAERNRTGVAAHLMDTVLSTSHEWVWAVDDQGIFTFSSPSCAGFIGWEPSELLGQRYDLVMDGLDLTQAKADVAATTGPGWSGVVVRCRHRNGTAVWMDVSGTTRPSTQGHRGGFEGTSRVLPPLSAREAIDSLSREKLQRMIEPKDWATWYETSHPGAGPDPA